MLPRFYRHGSGFRPIHLRLKHSPCPHCKVTGTLILHGYLRGYDLKKTNQRIIRGHRIFCSNRDRRKGCGKSFSIVLAAMLKRFIIQTSQLWSFLKNIAAGMNTFQAFSAVEIPLSQTSIYRLYKRVYFHQPNIRSRLLRYCAPPRNVRHTNPLIKTIHHIQSAFKGNPDPLAAFQHVFQQPFL
jgi:hypothetical protein